MASKWNPTNKFFTKNKGELMSDNLVEKCEIITIENPFKVLAEKILVTIKEIGIKDEENAAKDSTK